MRFAYFLLPVAATCLGSLAFSQPIAQDEKSVTMTTMTKEGDQIHTPTLSERVQNIEDQLKMDRKKTHYNPLHGYVNLEALCWKGKGNDQVYAFVNDAAPVPIATTTPQFLTGKLQSAESRWQPGSRLEAGYTTNYNWNMGAIWTYYHNESLSRKSTTKYDFVPAWVANNVATSGTFQYHLNYNTVDWQFDTNYCLGRYITFKPFVNVRAAWIRTTDRTHYRGLPSVDPGNPTDTTVVVHHGWWGVGPRVGSGAAFKFGNCGLSVFGDLSGSLLYGKAHDKRHATQNTQLVFGSGQTGPSQTIDWRESFGDLRSSLEMMIGAKYKWDFDHGKKAICLHAAWETNYWWQQGNSLTNVGGEIGVSNGFNFPSIAKRQESLILYGINAGLGFEY